MEMNRREMIAAASVIGMGATALTPDAAEAASPETKFIAGICNIPTTGWYPIDAGDADYNDRVKRFVRIVKHSGPEQFKELTPAIVKAWLSGAGRVRKARALFNDGDTATFKNIKLVYAISYPSGDPNRVKLFAVGGIWKSCKKAKYVDDALASIQADLLGNGGIFDGELKVTIGQVNKNLIQANSMIGLMLKRIKAGRVTKYSIQDDNSAPGTWKITIDA